MTTYKEIRGNDGVESMLLDLLKSDDVEDLRAAARIACWLGLMDELEVVHEKIGYLMYQDADTITKPSSYVPNRYDMARLAAQKGHTDIVLWLLGHDEDVERWEDVPEDTSTSTTKEFPGGKIHLRNTSLLDFARNSWGDAFVLALANGHEELACTILEYVSDRSFNRYPNPSFLHLAVKYNASNVLEALLDRGMDPAGTFSDYRKPLQVAARYGHPEMVRALVEAGVSPLQSNGMGGLPPLHIAIRHRHHTTIQAFADVGTDFNCPDQHGRPPAEMAALTGDIDVCLLVDKLGGSVFLDKEKYTHEYLVSIS